VSETAVSLHTPCTQQNIIVTTSTTRHIMSATNLRNISKYLTSTRRVLDLWLWAQVPVRYWCTATCVKLFTHFCQQCTVVRQCYVETETVLHWCLSTNDGQAQDSSSVGKIKWKVSIMVCGWMIWFKFFA